MVKRLLSIMGTIALILFLADILDRLVELEKAMNEMPQDVSKK